MNKEISIAFLGSQVPDNEKYQNSALNRSGNMVQNGIVRSIHKLKIKLTVFSLRPIESFPGDKKLFCGKSQIELDDNLKLNLIPFINIVVLKTIVGVVYSFFTLIFWAIKNRRNERYIIVYNTYTPPLPFVYWIGRLTGSKSIAILYDLGMPPKQLKLSIFKKNIYRLVEFFAKRFIPRLNGRIVITDKIAYDYSPGKNFVLIDGGVSHSITERLFDLIEKNDREKTVFLCAGSLWGANGTDLIIDALKINKNPKIEVWFAGSGSDENLIKKASENDYRIKYKGKLNLDQLFELYKEADVLLNLRVTCNGEGDYLFPSKILEYLTVGKYVLTTKVAHIEKEYGHLCKVLEENTTEQLSIAFDELVSLPGSELYRYGIKARQFMIETHTWDKQVLKIIDYIKEI